MKFSIYNKSNILISSISLLITFVSPIFSNLTFQDAQYSTIHYHTNGGTPISSRTFKVGDSIDIPTTTREGFTFVDWYTDISMVKEFNLTIMPAWDIKIYAKWDANLYTISFETNGGNTIPIIQGYFGDSIPLPNNPTRIGYTFQGWFRDSNHTNFFNLSSFPSMNLTLYAKWLINQYTISFDTNGGNSIQTQTKNYHTSLSLPNPTKVGHTFAGWFTDVRLTQAFTLTNMPAQNLTLYAKWTINQYTITFHTNGGNPITNETYDYGAVLVLPTPIRNGFSFAGWFTNVGLTQVAPINMPAQDINFYAKWNINQYSITFETNGGNTIEIQTYFYGDTLNLPTPTKLSHTFLGWFTDFELTQESPTNMPPRDITLYAKWVIYYTITFNTNNGNSIPNETYYYGDSLILPTAIKPGYSFAGWFTDLNLTQPAPEMMPAQDITLFAKWTINQYTITFETNGGTEIEAITGNFGDPITAPNNPTKEGHTFQGWYEDVGLTIPATLFDRIPSQNITYFAKWNILTFSVTWKNYDGSILQFNSSVTYGTIPVYYGSTPTRPSTYHVIPWEYWRSYTFSGWSPSVSPVKSNQVYVASFS